MANNMGKRSTVFSKIIAIALAAVLVTGVLILGILVAIYASAGELNIMLQPSVETQQQVKTAYSTPKENNNSNPSAAPTLPFFSQNPIPDIVEQVSPSVVGIVTYVDSLSEFRDELVVLGSGTGFVVSSDGYILTNEHVLEGAQQVRVLFADGTETIAQVVGSDITTDVAVLKIEATDLQPVTFGDSNSVRVGEFVMAIGNPLGASSLYGTVTLGIVSSSSREVNIDGHTNEYIQTDAAINLGNSGGPLINMNGEVIGMNTAKYITAGYDSTGNPISAEGIGFALPIDNVADIMAQLIANGQIVRPGIGVSVYALDDITAKELKLVPGIFIDSLTKGGPADEAGFKPSDIIVSHNGTPLTDVDQLKAILVEAGVGNKVTFKVYRAEKEIELTVTVGDMNKMP